MEDTATIHGLAGEAFALLKRGDREADGIGRVLVTDSPPEWMRDLCWAAHQDGSDGGMMPDDWRYEFIGDALNHIEEHGDEQDADDLRDSYREWCDEAYPYTNQRTAWLASHGQRGGYADEAVGEWGGEYDTTTRIALGMQMEALEVFESVLRSLGELTDEG